MLPGRSSFNKMRGYMKDKPHKWGTNRFVLCSAVTAYCIRFEVYCGMKQHSSDAHKMDVKSGPVYGIYLLCLDQELKRKACDLLLWNASTRRWP
ncbi:hypothetical protein PI124_g8940 [Phytophthora idaei]|nr:hypothetical protein PI124_g8940 [Phytophthora idaei]